MDSKSWGIKDKQGFCNIIFHEGRITILSHDNYSITFKFLIAGGKRGKMNNPIMWEPNKDESNIKFKGNLLVNIWIQWTIEYEYEFWSNTISFKHEKITQRK